MNFNKALLTVLSLFFVSSLQAEVGTYFNHIKKNPNALYAFLKNMPKGGELHYHLAGSVYPETMLAIAAKGDYCINKRNSAIQKSTGSCEAIQSKELLHHPELYSQVIKSWSMKDFIPGQESGHDHFFNSFMKFLPIVFDYSPELLTDIIQRAAEQQEQYLEIMTVPDNAKSTTFGSLIKNSPSFAEKKQLLLDNAQFKENISYTIQENDKILAATQKQLGCDRNPQSKYCAVKINFLYYILREQPIDNLFAQALNAFEAISHSKGSLVGVNLVQPEDGIISLRDYRKQMAIFQYLHEVYPKVNIALHAGELAPEAVTPKELRYHIRDALLTGHAQRIGHGVAIAYEDDAEETLKYMAKHHIPVEINLSSNRAILNISGPDHPLNYYLAHHVPVVLSTDDEGILRTDLTRQYVEAVINHNVDYPTLKQINRNALTYAFLPGESLWTNASKAIRVPACEELNSSACKAFIQKSEKAQLQWNLEQKLSTFENTFQN